MRALFDFVASLFMSCLSMNLPAWAWFNVADVRPVDEFTPGFIRILLVPGVPRAETVQHLKS